MSKEQKYYLSSNIHKNIRWLHFAYWLHFVVGKIDAKCNRLHFVAGYILRPYTGHSGPICDNAQICGLG